MEVQGNIVDVVNERIFKGILEILDGRIERVIECDVEEECYIMPGFIDSHIHVESSMLTPSVFASIALTHGTVAVLADPHEMANVCGIAGIKYMIDDARKVPLKFFFGAPSCVPATSLETSGAIINASHIKELIDSGYAHFLSEVMNYPGVINKDEEVLAKIDIAKKLNKRIDGHAPGLRSGELKKYCDAGISTDHECFTIEEANEKIRNGMSIQIREGSAAKNFNNLHSLISTDNEKVMLCSDDLHPDDLVKGHINLLVKRSLMFGHNLFDVLRAATLNSVLHYNIDVGLLQEGDSADFIIVDSLKKLNVLEVWIKGVKVVQNKKVLFETSKSKEINNFHCNLIREKDIVVKSNNERKIKIIEAFDGELITNLIVEEPLVKNGVIVSDTNRDILKIVVVNRYINAQPVVGFIKNFGLRKGALASSIAHDSHNIIAVGVSDKDITDAVNAIVEIKGGIVISDNNTRNILPLPIGGIMSNDNSEKVAHKYGELNKIASELGSKLKAPFMTLSFMALLVIPYFKIGDKGLFDGKKFEFVNLEE